MTAIMQLRDAAPKQNSTTQNSIISQIIYAFEKIIYGLKETNYGLKRLLTTLKRLFAALMLFLLNSDFIFYLCLIFDFA